MTSYYTNVFRHRNKLLVREIKNNQRNKYEIEYRPTLYIPSKNQKTQFTSIDGIYLDSIQPGTMKDCYEFIKKYENVDNFQIYGNTDYIYPFINEHYPDVIDYYNLNDLVLAYIDIEVNSKGGYSDAIDVWQPITTITIKNSADNTFHLFGTKKLTKPINQTKYYECRDEIDLLERFLHFWEKISPDILVGWNSMTFDIPYTINRIKKILDDKKVNKLSPWGIIKEKTINIFGKPEIVYEIAGVNHLDYYMIYKKNVLKSRENYKLGYIAEVELGEKKTDYGEYGTLEVLYEKNYDLYCEYNVNDVALLDKLEAQLKLIEQQLLVAYYAKANYGDVMSQVRTWDSTIANHLFKKNIIIPPKNYSITKSEQFVGAFVMKPIPGAYEDIVAFDVQSLYPNIMIALNLGIENRLNDNELTPLMRKYQQYINQHLIVIDEDGKANVNPDTILNGLTDELMDHFKEHNVCVSTNGIFYRKDAKSFFAELISELFANRLKYKSKMKNAQMELVSCTDPIKIAELKTLISIFDLKQNTTKVQLNSFYGSLGNAFFRYFNVKNAEAVTTTGQFIIQYIGKSLDAFLNRKMKTKDVRYVIYQDTDSCYISVKPITVKYFKGNDVYKRIEFIDQLCKESIQPEIKRLFNHLTDRYLNGAGDYLLMNRELIADKAIWCAKKRYIVNVRNDDGIIRNPAKIKYMGVEVKKSTIPKFCKNAIEQSVSIIMNGDQAMLHKYIADTKLEFNKKALVDISVPKSVNGLDKYCDDKAIFIKGTPGHVKAALFYNHTIKKLELNTQYALIKNGDKIKFFNLKDPNPFNCTTMAFLTEIPKEFHIEQYVDWNLQWQKSFIEPLQLILKTINWTTEPTASLDDLFE